MKKINIEGLEGKALETAQQFNAMVDKITEMESKGIKPEALEGLQNEMKALKESKLEAKQLKDLEDAFTSRVNELESKMNQKPEKAVSLKQAIVNFFEEKGIKSISDVKKLLTAADKDMEIKAADIDTTNFTGDVQRTISPVVPRFAPLRPMAFIPFAKQMTVGEGKNRIMWIPGTYTSNVGYAGEGVAHATGDAATAQEKYREFAKIAAKHVISAETFEDLPLFAQQLAMKMQENVMVYADGKMWDGDGNDSTQTKHIYGLKTQGVTAFSMTGIPQIEKANEADLMDAATVQIKLSQYAANAVWMSPGLAFKVRRLKDANGQYLVKELVDGSSVIGGLRIIEAQNFGDNEMLVGNTNAIQFYIKRNFIMKFGQFGDAVETDTYKTLLFARVQCLVEDEDKKALIYISDVNAAIAALSVGA